MKTISGKKIEVSSNKKLRHFTIKTESGKYRTWKMSKEEFHDNQYNTADDWQNFLSKENYFKIK